MKKGSSHTLETRERMSLARKGLTSPFKGKTHTQEARRTISLSQVGKKLSDETKKKMSLSHIGLERSVEHKMYLSEALKGRKLSEEHIQKLRLLRLGTKHTEQEKEKVSKALKGRKLPPWSDERRRKFSIFLTGRFVGPLASNWNGGTSFGSYAIQFNGSLKKLIRERDNFVCQLCAIPEDEHKGKLCIHHIDYDRQNCLEANLITLCRSCNGKVNNKRLVWQQYFGAKIGDYYA